MSVVAKQLDKHLQKIESLALKKEKEIEHEYYDKYYSIFESALNVLKKEHVLLYGGIAINALMPKNLKFYGEKELPDIDVFSTEAKKVAKRLVQHYKAHGYANTATFTEALHPNTFKVMVAGLQVVDLTQVSKMAFEKLQHDSVATPLGIKACNPEFLRMTLHTLMSQPVDSHRWSKTIKRLVAFYQVYPPKPTKPSAGTVDVPVTDDIAISMQKEAMKFVKQQGFVVFSAKHVLQRLPSNDPYVTKAGFYDDNDGCIHALVDGDVEDAAKQLHVFLKKDPNLMMSKVYQDDFVGPLITVYWKDIPLAMFVQTSACLSYVSFSGLKVASIQTVLRLYLSMVLSPYNTHKHEELENMANVLTLMSMKNLFEPKSRVLQSFVLHCYGAQSGMATMKRNRFVRNLNAKKR